MRPLLLGRKNCLRPCRVRLRRNRCPRSRGRALDARRQLGGRPTRRRHRQCHRIRKTPWHQSQGVPRRRPPTPSQRHHLRGALADTRRLAAPPFRPTSCLAPLRPPLNRGLADRDRLPPSNLRSAPPTLAPTWTAETLTFQATGMIKAIRIRTLCGPTEREFARQWAFMSRRIGVPREVLKHLAFCTQLVAETPALLEVSLNTRLHRLLHGPPQSRWVPEVYTISDHLNLAACWLILASHLEASALGKPA